MWLLWRTAYIEVLGAAEYLFGLLTPDQAMESDLRRAKLYIGQAMAHLALANHHDATKSLQEAAHWIHQYHGGEEDGDSSHDCYEEMRWAAHEYLEELAAVSNKKPKLEPTLVIRPINFFTGAEFCIFWEWLTFEDTDGEEDDKENEEEKDAD
jgi:hypothetical protein